MKILYLHQYFQTPLMAGGTRSFEMARRLVARGHEVHVITADTTSDATGSGWRVTQEAGIHVHWIAISYSNLMGFHQRLNAFVRFAWHSARRAAQIGGDVVFATSTPLTIAFPGVFASRRLRIPMVFEVRDLWPDVPIELGVLKNPVLKGMARRLEDWAYRNSKRVVALAPGMKDAVVATGYPADRVSVIPNGADLDIFCVDDAQGLRLRRKTPWLSNRPMLLYCGALGEINGVDFLAKLAHAVSKIDPEICFVVIGDGKRKAHLRAEVERNGTLGRTFFLLDAKPKIELPEWLSASTLTMALINGPKALWANATQNKFFDSLAAGRPVVSNFRGYQSIVAEQADCGLIVDHDDPEASAEMLISKLRDAGWLSSASQVALELARTRFNRDYLALELERVLQEAVSDEDSSVLAGTGIENRHAG